VNIARTAAASLLLYLFSLSPLFSQERACSYVIVHINGVGATWPDVYLNLAKLENLIGPSHNGVRIKYETAYNATRGSLSDFAETIFEQKVNEYPGATAAALVSAFFTSVVGSEIPLADRGRLGFEVVAHIVDALRTPTSEADLASIVNELRISIIGADALLMVPHSQGALYANAAYEVLRQGEDAISAQSIKIMAIAAAASSIAGEGEHVTSSNDDVINPLRATLGAVDHNITIPKSFIDPMGHSMVDTYLGSASGSSAVKSKILNALNNLVLAVPAREFIGIWTGTWSGDSFGRSSAVEVAPTAPVGGTWILKFETIDSGSVTWNGTDAFWTYTHDSNGRILTATPHPFIPNRTVKFSSTNTTIIAPQPGGKCTVLRMDIQLAAGAVNPSDAFYGPRFMPELDADTGILNGIFNANPYNSANFDTALSSGSLSGSKMQ